MQHPLWTLSALGVLWVCWVCYGDFAGLWLLRATEVFSNKRPFGLAFLARHLSRSLLAYCPH